MQRWCVGPSSATSSHVTQRVAAHPAPGRHVVRGRRGRGEHGDDGARRRARGPRGEPDHRQRAAQAARVDDRRTAASQARPPRARRAARSRRRASGSIAAGSRSTSSARSGRHAASGRVTRTLPWVSTPIAASTWLGSSVLEVQAEPRRHREARAGRARRPAPRRRRRGREGHDVGQPVVGVADDLGVGDRRRGRAGSGRPARRRARARRRGSPRSAARPRRRPGRAATHRLGVGAPVLDLADRPGPAPPGALGHDEHARAGGAAPRARVADEHVVRTWAPRVAAQRRHRVDQQRHAVGPGALLHRRQRLAGADLAVGALHRGGRRRPAGEGASSSASRSTRPRASTGTSSNSDGSPGVAARWRPRVRTPECSTAEATSRAPRRRPACSSPVAPGAQGHRVRTGGTDSSGGPHAQPGGDAPRGPGRAAPGPAGPRRAAAAGRPSRRRARPAACRARRGAAGPPDASSSARGGGCGRSGGTHADGSPTLKPVRTRRWSRVCAVGSTSKLEGAHLCVGTMTLPRRRSVGA